MSYTDTFRDSEFLWVRKFLIQNFSESEILDSEFSEPKCALLGCISRLVSREKGEFFAHAKFLVPRARQAEICPCRAHFGLKMKRDFIFKKPVFARAEKLQILTSEFLKYWRNWSRIGAAMVLNFANFARFRIFRSFDFRREIAKLNAVRGIDPSDFKNFWPHYV